MNSVVVSFWLAGFLRSLGFIIFLPFGFDSLGGARRIVLALLVGAVLLVGAPWPSESLSVLQLGGEFILGAILAVPLLCVVGGAMMWGEIFDAIRGESIGTLYEPTFGPSATVALLARSVVWAVLLSSGVLTECVALLGASVKVVPLGQGWALGTVGPRVMVIGIEVLRLWLDAALPWIALFLLCEVAGVFVGRIAPQLPLNGEYFLVKTLLGFTLLGILEHERVGEQLVALARGSGGAVLTALSSVEGVFTPSAESP